APVCLFSRLPTVERRRILRSEHTNLLLLFCADADGTDVLKVPLLIVEPKQRLIPSAAGRIVCCTCEKLLGYGRKNMSRLKGSSNGKPDLDRARCCRFGGNWPVYLKG